MNQDHLVLWHVRGIECQSALLPLRRWHAAGAGEMCLGRRSEDRGQ